jgi:hypothetical protein|nr:MAG TPA: hypothetical protein [Ackermannviridae sp.]
MFEHIWEYKIYKDEYSKKSREELKQELSYYIKRRAKLKDKFELNREKMNYIEKYFNSIESRECLWRIYAIEKILNEYNSKYKLGSVL